MKTLTTDKTLFEELQKKIIRDGSRLSDRQGSKEWVKYRLKILKEIFNLEPKQESERT